MVKSYLNSADNSWLKINYSHVIKHQFEVIKFWNNDIKMIYNENHQLSLILHRGHGYS